MEIQSVSTPDDVSIDHEATAARARSDREAFGALYVAHRETVFRYLRARCGSDDDALDLTGVTFERALAAIPRYASRGGGVVAWLLRIARNAVIDQERRRRPLIPQWKAPEHASPDPTPEEASINAEERRTLREHLAQLPAVQRDALALRYAAGLTASEIGAVIGKSEEATQKLMSRAIARLKEGLS